jgi:hypothetical protein
MKDFEREMMGEKNRIRISCGVHVVIWERLRKTQVRKECGG